MKEEKKKIQKYFIVSAGLLSLFVLYTIAIMFIDVRSIGPQGSTVGFAKVNQYFHELIGVNMLLYNINGLVKHCCTTYHVRICNGRSCATYKKKKLVACG